MKITVVEQKLGEKSGWAGYLHEYAPQNLPKSAERPCVVICPGGGYHFLSPREDEPVAAAFFAAGYQVFVLHYTVGDDARPMGEAPLGLTPLVEISSTVMHIRAHASQWHIDPQKIVVCGFSAGGHLAASLGVLWDKDELKAVLDTKQGANRPNAMVLCYPVITAGEYAHRGSFSYLTGESGAAGESDFFSLEKQVDEKSVPTFLWHTQQDTSVPVENALLLAGALQKHQVPLEMHLYTRGEHGLSLCSSECGVINEHCKTWFSLCLSWLSQLLDI